MKKKVMKKKTAAKNEVVTSSDDVEMPMARIDDDDDVAEDYKVMDMSDIAAPVIEFELSNLVKKEVETSQEDTVDDHEDVEEKKVKKKQTTTKKKAVVKKMGKKEPLTAEKLNNELVRMRATVVKAKTRMMGKLVRQKKQLESKSGKEVKNKEEVQRKLARLGEEIIGLKTIDKDAVAKFAALNTKTLDELKIDGKTPVAERLMYKLACQDIVIEAVDSFKDKYFEWNKTAAFFMQRLGLQYSNKPEKKTEKNEDSDGEKEAEEASETNDSENGEEEEEEDNDEESTGGVDDGDYNESDVEMVDSDEEAGVKAAQKRRNLLLGLIGVKEDKARPTLNPKKRKIEDDGDEAEPVLAKKESNFKKGNQAKQGKKGKKAVVSTTEVTAPAPEKGAKPRDDEPIEEDSNQETLVLKIDLSKGGKIAASKAKAPVPKRKVPESTAAEDDDEGSDDESAAFFLPKTTAPALRKTKRVIPKKANVDELKDKKRAAPVPEKKEVEHAPPVEKKKGSSKNKGTSEEVHPSWAASQQKKKEMQAAKPCGKKITFGDDD